MHAERRLALNKEDMAIRKIATIGHPILRERAREVTKEELASEPMQRFIDDPNISVVSATAAIGLGRAPMSRSAEPFLRLR